jgi:hypothetical protein
MVATATLWAVGASPTTAGTTWANTGNTAGANDGTFATFINAASGGTGSITLTGYSAQDALAQMQPASVDSIQATCFWYVNNTTRFTAASCTARLFDGTTALGTGATAIGALSTTTSYSTSLTFTGVATWANLGALSVQLFATHATTTAGTFNIDAVGLVVNYTPSSITPPNVAGGTVGDYLNLVC